MIKDGYDSQIKDYDHQLNGYTKETAYGKKHFFGAAEISQMFESATPELLHKIAGVIAEHGCKDEKKWIQKSPWYREFELGREAERQLKRGNGRDKRLRQDLTLLNITGLGNVVASQKHHKKMPSSDTITSIFSSKIKLLVV